MQLALEQAYLAEKLGEVPVGAVVLHNGTVVGLGHNQTLSNCDPTAHAEIVALRAAALALGNHRLEECTLYVTLEPCAMCMGAIFHSRIAKVYFGAADAKTGACGSVLNLPGEHRINHHCQVQGGVLQSQCAQHLSAYFARLRSSKRQSRMPVREDALRLPNGALSRYMEGVHALPIDDLEAASGLRVQVWHNTQSPEYPVRLVLCLHGATSWSSIYHDLLTAPLDGTTAVWALDLPGHGGSDKTKKGQEFDPAYQLNVLNALLRRSPAPSIHVLAQDTGCELAVRLAACNPDRVVGLTLCNPVCIDSRHLILQGEPVRSRPQFIASLQRQCAGSHTEAQALSAPYPDAGHMAGMLQQFNGATAGMPASLPATVSVDCARHSVVHTSTAFFAESLLFQSRFGLTFEREEHHAACVYLGPGRPAFWRGVLAQMNRNG